ncbi:MAG: hypothetical protein ACR2PS_16870, partial [Pseudomonadales bacterium]
CKAFHHPLRSSYLLDLGATIDCGAEQLVEFARLAHHLVNIVQGIDRPAIALLSNGIEDSKGNASCRRAAALLQQDSKLNYCGYIEADALFVGAVDIVVFDGFVGNIALKSAEGAAQVVFDALEPLLEKSRSLTKQNQSSKTSKPAIDLLRKQLEHSKKQWLPQQHNGAFFLGLDGIVVKSHGAASVAAFAQAIGEAHQLLSQNVAARLRQVQVVNRVTR